MQPKTKKNIDLILLVVGLIFLAVGGFPWVYTPTLTGDLRPGGEGAGLMGTIIFLFVGIPGLLLTMAGCRRFLKRKDR